MDIERILEPVENAYAEPEMNLVPEVDARASSECSSQQWMLQPEVDARARSGCHARTRIGKSIKKRIDQDACFLSETLI